MQNRWDKYFYEISNIVSKQSRCLSRQIGSVLVKDNVIVSTGYNGPPRGMPPCNETFTTYTENGWPECPRYHFNYKSGKGLHLCPAVHSEENCIANAARVGVNTKGCSIYMNCEIPCKRCLGILINAGISEIICNKIKFYDDLASEIVSHSNLVIRQFKLS